MAAKAAVGRVDLVSKTSARFGGYMSKRLTAVIHREGDGFVALCPELDVASQGDTIEAARDNLREALELFFECASAAEVQQRLGEEVFITQVEVACG
jgi:predicted RNase H-like HicB family nuclease